MLGDNRTAEFAEWIEPVLAKLREQLRMEDALDGVGYSVDDINALALPRSPAEGVARWHIPQPLHDAVGQAPAQRVDRVGNEVLAPRFFTPRVAMHWCSQAITTATANGKGEGD